MTPGRFDPERTLAAIDRLKPTVLIAVPTLFRRLLALGEAIKSYDLRSLRMGMSSGEPLPDDTLRSAREWLGIEIYDCLGQTEIHIFMNPDPVKKLGSLGRPFDGHVVTILTDDGREAQVNEIGHLVIRADDPGLCLGYRGRPDIWSADTEGRLVLHQRSRLLATRTATSGTPHVPTISSRAVPI